MPPRWPRQPTRDDPAFRKLDDRMNFALHVAVFAAVNSGIWFTRQVQAASWGWPVGVTGIWLLALMAHGVFIFAIANYSDATTPVTPEKK